MSEASKQLEELIDDLSDTSRKKRQDAAIALAELSVQDPQAIVPYGQALVDALDLSDVRTRWAVIDALTALSSYDAALCVKALPGIENALFDEAIQCFHGDQEFQDMLNLLVEFSKGHLSEETKKGFIERMSFDAKNNKGLTQRRAQTIVDNLSE